MKQLGVQYSYTLEASVCGTLTGSDSSLVHTHFNIQDFQEMGKTFCETLADFFNPHPAKVSFPSYSFSILSFISIASYFTQNLNQLRTVILI
jgi:hypothetical protein